MKSPVLLVLLFSGILMLSSFTGCGAQEDNAAAPVLVAAPDFTVTLFEGGKLTLSELRGRPVVLNVWASWCPSCRTEAPTLERVWRTYKDKGVVFLGLDVQDDEKDARAFIEEFGLTYPNGRGDDNEIATSYRISGIPSTFFITRDGMIARRWVGAIQEKQLVAFTEEILR